MVAKLVKHMNIDCSKIIVITNTIVDIFIAHLKIINHYTWNIFAIPFHSVRRCPIKKIVNILNFKLKIFLKHNNSL